MAIENALWERPVKGWINFELMSKVWDFLVYDSGTIITLYVFIVYCLLINGI